MDVEIMIQTDGQWSQPVPNIHIDPTVPLVVLEKHISGHLKDTIDVDVQSLVENYDLYAAACVGDHSKSTRPIKYPFSRSLHAMGFEKEGDMRLILIPRDPVGNVAMSQEEFMLLSPPKIVEHKPRRKRSILKTGADHHSDPTRRVRHVGIQDPHDSEAKDDSHFHCRPSGYSLGAYITGVDARQPLDLEVVRDLRLKLLEHKVIILRLDNSAPLTEKELDTFTKYFGQPISEYPRKGAANSSEEPSVRYVSNLLGDAGLGSGELPWHSDLSYRQIPAAISVANCNSMPDGGPPTGFANCTRAYASLEGPKQDEIKNLKAIHRHKEDHRNAADEQPVIHPLVRTHPETGELSIFAEPERTQSIVDMSPEASAELLEFLVKHQTDSQFVFEHDWKVGDIAVWDNRCVMHHRDAFKASGIRLLKRTMILMDSEPK